MEPNHDVRVEGHRAYELRADNSRKWTKCRQHESSATSHPCSVGEHMAPRAPEIHLWDGMEGGRQC